MTNLSTDRSLRRRDAGGLCAAFPGGYRCYRERDRIIARAQDKPRGKVGVVSGSGFGHLPLFTGYVGEGLIDACAVGEVFAGPALDDVLETHRATDRGAGVATYEPAIGYRVLAIAGR